MISVPRHTPKRKEPVLDYYIRASIEQANRHHDRNGRYATLTVTLGTRNDKLATEYRNALYRSAYHMNVGLDAEMTTDSSGNYQITFTAIHPSYRDDYWDGLAIWKRKRNIGQ
jgi:hypothetical protein